MRTNIYNVPVHNLGFPTFCTNHYFYGQWNTPESKNFKIHFHSSYSAPLNTFPPDRMGVLTAKSCFPISLFFLCDCSKMSMHKQVTKLNLSSEANVLAVKQLHVSLQSPRNALVLKICHFSPICVAYWSSKKAAKLPDSHSCASYHQQ